MPGTHIGDDLDGEREGAQGREEPRDLKQLSGHDQRRVPDAEREHDPVAAAQPGGDEVGVHGQDTDREERAKEERAEGEDLSRHPDGGPPHRRSGRRPAQS